MAAAPTAAEAASSSGEAADPLAVALRAAAVQSVALVLVNAAQHLQRTAALVEAATAASLARALMPGAKPDDGWTTALEVSRQAMVEASEAYRQALSAAIDLGKAIAP